MVYKHTQVGYLVIYVFLAVSLLFAVILFQTGFNFAIFAMMFLILLALASFMLLKVTVNEKVMEIKFGYGIIQKKFLLKGIKSAKIVKNRWYYGWGIRLLIWPTVWIYNVSGLDAVEITMKNGKRYRIGTDEPKKLERAILQSIN